MKFSICMMVKNESKYLEQCLQSMQPIRDAIDSELIIVDTGSEDNTVDIAKKYTNKVYFHEWNNDFSQIRNVTIKYATGQWIFIIDGDEVLQETQPLIDFLNSTVNKKVGAVAITSKNVMDVNDPLAFSSLVSARLFRNDGYFHYEGVIHNQAKFKGVLIEISTSLLHYGYLETDKELMETKFVRTSTLLKGELAKDPQNIYYWYQLSVSYGMHNDVDDSIQCAEKAYELFLERQKPQEFIYVLVHLAHMYQLTHNYKKVEKICLESLAIKTGYMDVYYFLAEAQAVLGKPQEAIANYQEYLAITANQDQAIERDTAVIDYTANNQETVYYNLCQLYRKINNYDKAIYYAEILTKKEYIQDNLELIIWLYIQQNKYDELKKYYTNVIEKNEYKLFYEKLEAVNKKNDNVKRRAVAEKFVNVNDTYGLLSRMIIEDQNGGFSTKNLDEIEQLDFSELPLYYSNVLYYLVKNHYPLHKVLISFKEIWITSLFENIVKEHDDLSVQLYKYLQEYAQCKTISEFKLSKALCRYLLILDKLKDDDYKKIFDRYVHDGIFYLKLIYNADIIDNALVYEVKNDEEVFLLYMYQAQINKAANQIEYVSYLQQALEGLPIMKKGIEMLLEKIKAEMKAEENKQHQMENYNIQVKNAIKQLIESGHLIDAKVVIGEYKSIVPNDMEMLLFESEILLKENASQVLEQ